MKTYGYIYKFTNRINGKIYIGKREYPKGDIDPNYYGSGTYYTNALKKRGRESFKAQGYTDKEIKKMSTTAIKREGIKYFKFEVLQWCYNNKELCKAEKWHIAHNDCLAKDGHGYNIADGGQGGNLIIGYTEEEMEKYRKKCSEAQKNPETIKKHSESASKPIIAYYFKDDTHTEIIRIPFKSALETSEKTGIDASHISQFIKGTIDSSYIGKIDGMRCIWSYASQPYTDSEAIEMLNNAYKSKGKGSKPKRLIIIINVLTNETKPYEGQRKAARKLNINQGKISKACNGIYMKNSHLYDNWLCYFEQDWEQFSEEQQEQLIDDAIKLYNSRQKQHHERILAVNKKTGEEKVLDNLDKAMEFVGVRNNGNISKACYGKGWGKNGHCFKNYYWYYIDSNDNIIPDNEL